MRILVLSLLRLGDILLAAPALAGLRAKNPKAEIHVVVNQAFVSIAPLLPMVDKVIGFDRDLLQQGLVEADRPLFEPFDRLQSFVQDLNSQNYDCVVNLTQTRFSGYLSALIHADEKIGLSLNNKGQASFGSTWFRYLNNIVGAGAKTIFHYSDIFQFGVGMAVDSMAVIELGETANGKKEYEEWRRLHPYTNEAKIVLQCQTSDEKKNWPIEAWVAALRVLSLTHPKAELIALGASFEKTKIEKLVELAASKNIKITPALLGLEGALTLINESDLVVTGDTSIKHLAALTSTRIIEIALGSSDLRKTGALKADSLILSSAESCAPCSHESKCHRDRHYCAESLSPEFVGLVMSRYLQKDWASLRLLAAEYADSSRIHRARRMVQGFWYAEDLRVDQFNQQISDNLDRAAWKFLLEREHTQRLATYGSESMNLKNWLDDQNIDTDGTRVLKMHLEQIENTTASNQERLSRLIDDVTRQMRSVGSLTEFDFIDRSMLKEMSDIEKALGLGQFLTEKTQIERDSGLFRARQLQSSLNEAALHQQIKLKLVRSLKNMITEYQ